MASGCPQLLVVVTGGVSPPRGDQSTLSMVGHTKGGSASVQIQYQVGQVHFQDQGSSSFCSGQPDDTIGPVLSDLCLPSNTASPTPSTKDSGGETLMILIGPGVHLPIEALVLKDRGV